jgi:NADH:ubiquinone oxidoreductase subunit 6 (subunit J)
VAAQLTWWALAVVTLAGAAGVISTREIMRLVLALGTFLLGVAGFFAYYALPFLAVAQVFVYVGGVLVLFLFAIMAHKPDEEGRRRLSAGFDIGVAVTCAGLFVLLLVTLWPLGALVSPVPLVSSGPEAAAGALLGPLLPLFELLGTLLLAALVAGIAIAGRGDER